VRGGVYSIEVVPPSVDQYEGWHVHLHSVLVVDVSVPWLQADARWLQERRSTHQHTTPALVWFARSWAAILRRWWPERYRELPLTRELLPSVRRNWPGITVECPERLAVCDLGGRWPDKQDRSPVLPLYAPNVRGDLQQALKYIAKPVGDDAAPDRSMWVDLIAAMAGRRRAQTWGCWYGVRLTEPEEHDVDDEEPAERTGRVLYWTNERTPDISRSVGAFWYGWTQVGGVQRREGWVLATVSCRQTDEDGL
jgi:hypothetical protein